MSKRSDQAPHDAPDRATANSADARLCAHEPALPGLNAVLAAPATAASLGLSGLRHSYLRYKPGTSCVAGLIPMNDALEVWSAMTVPPARWAQLRRRPSWTEGPVQALFLDEALTVLVPLRLERRLRTARALVDPDARARLLGSLGLENCALRVLRYKPGRRIVLRADGPEGPRAVVKLHADASAFDRAAAGAAHASRCGGPELLATAKDAGAIAVAWVPGRTLGPADDPGDFALAGATLASHHARAVEARLPPIDVTAPGTALGALGALEPALMSDARRIAARLPDLPSGCAVALHGDFSADQIVLGSSGTSIVDWDRAASGPAARDLGSALARLDLDRLRGIDTDDAAQGLLDGYAEVVAPPPTADVAAYRAHALLALATDGFRERHPHWDEEIVAVLRRVEALCVAPRPSPGRAMPRCDVQGSMGSLELALDPDRMNRVLSAALASPSGDAPIGESAPARLTASITRLKPGRRAMVRYERADGPVLLGKLGAKGSDRRAPDVQRRLHRAGLDGRHGVGVPGVAAVLDTPPMWLQQEVSGLPLGRLLDADPDRDLDREGRLTDALRRTGRALAALHATPPANERHWTVADELAVLERAVAGSPQVDLLELAARRLSSLPPEPPVGLHRDFYFDQVLIAEETVWLVDLDLHACGDPAVDLGNFLAHLSELDLRRRRAPGFLAPLGEAFLAGYAAHRRLPPAARVDAYHWVSLARHVAIAKRFPERRHAIAAIASLCRERLSVG